MDSRDTGHQADHALVRRFLDGSADAERDLVARLRCVPRMVAAYNRRRGRILEDHELADVSQEALIVILRGLHRFAGHARLETWVYQFCVFEFQNYLRRRRTRSREQPTEHLEPATPEPEVPSGDLERVLGMLRELRGEEEEAIRLRHFEGLSFDQIAARLDASSNTIKARYYRGMEKLKRKLGVQEEAES